LGTVWSYNNAGFYLAAHIMEIVTGESYQAALRELVLEPLSLENVFLDAGDVITRRFAVGHNVTGETVEVCRPWPLPRAAYGAGGISSNVEDLLRYARFQLGTGKTEDGAQLLAPESLSLMHTPQVTIGGAYDAVGLAWFIARANDTRYIGHGGGTNGQISLLSVVPERDFAVAVLTNANCGGLITRDVTRWAMKEYLELAITDPSPQEATPEELAGYAGRYSRPFAEIELGVLGGRLIGQLTPKAGFPAKDSPVPSPPPPMTLAPYDKDMLIVLDGPYKDARAEIIRKADGEIGWLRFGGRIHVRSI
jgi:CubicO group peptidase (beta-lactamase class C family)